MSLDYSQFEDMLQSFKELQKQHEVFIRKFLTEMGMRTLAQTKKLTPVDTGELRNRWELSEVFRTGDELYVVISNTLDYAPFVEDGHMQQARWVPGVWKGNVFEYQKDAKTGMMLKTKWVPGTHMARISITKAEIEMPVRFSKAFKQFCKDLGVGE